MRSYAPAASLGSITYDYFSRVHTKVYDLLSNLKVRAASYLSKLLYHVNIVGRLNECEQKIQGMIELDSKLQALEVVLDNISERVIAYEGHFTALEKIRDTLGEITRAPNAVEQLGTNTSVLEGLLSKLPKQ